MLKCDIIENTEHSLIITWHKYTPYEKNNRLQYVDDYFDRTDTHTHRPTTATLHACAEGKQSMLLYQVGWGRGTAIIAILW